MFWKKKRGKKPKESDRPEIPLIEAKDSGWGVPILDVRPVTQTMLSGSQDPECATNLLSFQTEDGLGFVGDEPPNPRVIETGLRYPVDPVLADGVLFAPTEMEHKWALFHHGNHILFVRSWTRQVIAVAEVSQRNGFAELPRFRGSFFSEDEDPAYTVRAAEFLLRSHALGRMWPAPLLPGMEQDPHQAAMWCLAMFGTHAHIATVHDFEAPAADVPLRSHSLLHIAVARGDVSAAEAQLASGLPADLLAGDGDSPMHWALAGGSRDCMELLLDRGCPVDVRTDQGATPLMNAVQGERTEMFSWLLDHGADVDARDHRGFTALHRAAEMGFLQMVAVLLERGASPAPEAEGHTPLSLALAREQKEIAALLRRRCD